MTVIIGHFQGMKHPCTQSSTGHYKSPYEK